MDRLIYLAVRLLSAVLELLPIPIVFGIARQVGSLCYVLMPKRRQIALDNIRAALGDSLPPSEQKKLARTSFQNISLSIVELFLIRKICANAERLFKWKNREYYEEAFRLGKGLLLTVSHAGSWELLGILPYLTPRDVSVVVKLIRNPYLNKRVDELRREMKLTPIPKYGAAREVLRRLKNNGCVGILIDQWAGAEGLWVDFFGRGTSTTSLPARLAQKTGCCLMPAYCLREPNGGYTIVMDEPVELPSAEDPEGERKVTQELSRRLEEQIRKRPEQWIWTHRRWKPKPHTLREM